MNLTLTLVITIITLTVILFACANQSIKDRRQIKHLQEEIKKYKENMIKYLSELALIKKDGAEIENEIKNAKTEEEVIDILGDIISRNNNRVSDNKTK